MTNKNEMVADIVREMREVSVENGFKDLAEWCDRIEAAHKREEMRTMASCAKDAARDMAGLQAENKSLREALRVVSRWLATEASDTEVLTMKSDDVRKLVTDALKGGK